MDANCGIGQTASRYDNEVDRFLRNSNNSEFRSNSAPQTSVSYKPLISNQFYHKQKQISDSQNNSALKSPIENVDGQPGSNKKLIDNYQSDLQFRNQHFLLKYSPQQDQPYSYQHPNEHRPSPGLQGREEAINYQKRDPIGAATQWSTDTADSNLAYFQLGQTQRHSPLNQKTIQQSSNQNYVGPFPSQERDECHDFKIGKRKKSAFKSVRSFFKNILFNNNSKTDRANTAQKNAKRISSASLYDYAKPNSSLDIVYSGDLPDNLNESRNETFTRTRSFSASKMRRDSFTSTQRRAGNWTPGTLGPCADVDSLARYRVPSSSSTATVFRPPPSPSRDYSQRHYYTSIPAASHRMPSSTLVASSHTSPLPPRSTSSSNYILRNHYGDSTTAISSVGADHNGAYGHANSSLRTTTIRSSEVPSSASPSTSDAFKSLGDRNSATTNTNDVAISHAGNVNLTGNFQRSSPNAAATRKDNINLTDHTNNTNENENTSATTKTSSSIFETPCLNGILNHGNTCYMNAIVQCLACIDRFAEFFVCEKFNGSSATMNSSKTTSATCILASILQNLWFNAPADGACLKLLKFMNNECTHFRLSTQQDAQESLIWVLDRIHEEIKDVYVSKANSLTKHYKSEEQLASDALKRVSGSNHSAIMDLFSAQFRSSMECVSCGFSNLTFDPYMTVSLSVLQSYSVRSCKALFVPYFQERQLVWYYFALSSSAGGASVNGGISTIFHVKDKIMRGLAGCADNLIACHFSPNGQCRFLSDEMRLSAVDEMPAMEYTMIEIPKLSEQQELNQHLIVVIVTHVRDFYPNCKRHAFPYVVVLNREMSYDQIAKCIMTKGSFIVKTSSPPHADFKLLMQHSSDGFLHLDHGVTMPLFNQFFSTNKQGVIYRIVVEWNPITADEYLRSVIEPVIHDHTYLRDATLVGRETNTTLSNLLQDYIKSETVPDWKCPKCLKTSGKKELKFHSMPPVLVFHLKRFELLNDGATKKIDTRVQVPLDSLDMSPYICNPDSRFNTLKSSKKETNGLAKKTDAYESAYLIYDLVGVVRHHGDRANSGHYTATTRNPIDGKWRNFDDLKVTLVPTTDETMRTSSDAYLLFYECRHASVASDLFDGTTTPAITSRRAFSWFPKEVPNSVIEACEQLRATQSRGLLERRNEQLCRELDDCSLVDRTGYPHHQSGGSTFYTGSALIGTSASNGDGGYSPTIARSYTEQLHYGDTQNPLWERFSSLPARRSSVNITQSTRSYPSNSGPSKSDYSTIASASNGIISPSRSYYYETVGGTLASLSRVGYGTQERVVSPSTSNVYESERFSAGEDRARTEYKSLIASDHGSIGSNSPRRSRSQYALSGGSPSSSSASATTRSPLKSSSLYRATTATGNGVGGGYSSYYPPSSSSTNRSRSNIRPAVGGSDILSPTKSHYLLSTYRH